MNAQTYFPPPPTYKVASKPRTGTKSVYGTDSVHLVPDPSGHGETVVVQSEGHAPLLLEAHEHAIEALRAGKEAVHNALGALGSEAHKVVIGKQPAVTSQTISYGSGGPDPLFSGRRMEDAMQIALVVLLVWIGIQFLRALARGMKAAFSFLWWVVTAPFRLASAVLRFALRLPQALLNGLHTAKPAIVGVGHTVRGTYEAFAESFNDETARQQAVETARRRVQKARTHLEKTGRKLGQRLSRLGLADEEPAAQGAQFASYAAGPWPQTSRSSSNPQFEGYSVLSEMPRGGSGARLFRAKPTTAHARMMAERGIELPSDVVIKSFSLDGGAHMTGILREGRALDAARRLGQVFEHHSGEDGLYYVMPFVPGVTLDEFIAQLHGIERGVLVSSQAALGPKELQKVLALQLDLLVELERFHANGLWHKDIKPANLIVNQGRLHVVDLGLLTPLASALTLTTHGTEYYRDPEMVRLAMRGAQVRDVDAAKFDLYSAGAVLFSMLEGTFPAHGNLSRLQRPCPPALGWIVRRAMAEHDSRYASAQAMREDVAFLLQHKDLDAIKPKHLPSWKQGSEQPEAAVAPVLAAAADGAAPMPPKPPKRRCAWKAGGTGEPQNLPAKVLRAGLIGGGLLLTVAALSANRRAQANHGVATHIRPVQAKRAPVAPTTRTLDFLNGHEPLNGHETNLSAKLVESLVQAVPAASVRNVYLHTTAQGVGWVTGLAQTLKQHHIDSLPTEGGHDEAALGLAAEVSRLLDGLPTGEEPDAKSLVEFFIHHPEVQAILDGVGVGDSKEPRWVLSPLLQ